MSRTFNRGGSWLSVWQITGRVFFTFRFCSYARSPSAASVCVPGGLGRKSPDDSIGVQRPERSNRFTKAVTEIPNARHSSSISSRSRRRSPDSYLLTKD